MESPPGISRRTGPSAVTTSTPIVELRQVSRTFGSQAVLRDVTLPVYRGETLVLIGESGCGKSVTLKLLMRLMEPSSGEVLWNGRPIAPLSDRELSRERLRFGYLFQMAALFDSLTVYENVAFGLRQNRRLPEEHVRQIVRDRLRDVGLSLDVVEHKKPAQLSGGMKKRVGLARAMLYNPRWPWHAAARLGARVHAPPQYLRCQPAGLRELFNLPPAGATR